MSDARDRWDALAPMGVPASGKSRFVSRPLGRNISHSTDRARIARHYDLWYERVFPCCRFVLTVRGEDPGSATQAIRELLAR